ncbi:MAG: outer membrane beta-barrel protein [Bacteroidota bacterium]
MRFLATALLTAALLAPEASAQYLSSPTEGFQFGGRLYGAGLGIEDDRGNDDTASGGGLGVRVGYGFSRTVTAFLSLEGAQLTPDENEFGEEFALGTLDLGARFNLSPSAAVNPYAEVALTGQVAAFDVPGTSETLDLRGGGLTVGGGIVYFFSQDVGLDVGVDLTAGRFTEVEFDGEVTDNFEEIDSGIVRLGFGVVWNP